MREYTIDEKSSGTKLLNFIKKLTPEIKNSDLFKIIRKGVIVVNDKKSDFSYKLADGDTVTFFLAEEYFKRAEKKPAYPHYKLAIVYEDAHLLLINKPRGMLVHADGNDYKNNLVEYIKGYLYRKGEYTPEAAFTPTLCNRLDYNTSGIIVAAKDHETLKKVTAHFRKRTADKRYMTLVYGITEKRTLITSKLLPKTDTPNMMMSLETAVIPDGEIPDKEAFIAAHPEYSATLIRRIAHNDRASLVEVELWTGRKHQIRCQLQAAGHPLLGDFKYYTGASVAYSNEVGIAGYYLHSFYIELAEYGRWEIPLDDAFKITAGKLFDR